MIFPKQIDINKAKAQERKSQIDEGLVLARRIDELRQMRLQMEKNFEEWRIQASKGVQEEINGLIEQRDILNTETIEARKVRDKLLEPLDQDWKVLKNDQETLVESLNDLFLERERIDIERKDLEKEKDVILVKLSKITLTENNLKKERIEIERLKENTQKEYDMTHSFKEKQEKEYEESVSETTKLQKEYQVGLKLIEVREKQVEDKELELITRENNLARRTKNLQRAEELK